MKIGLVYPQNEYPSDPAAIRDFAQTAEGLGYTHILAYDHILGANPERPGGWRGPYTYNDPFVEPFLLFTFMAAHTTRLGFIPGILILPQRQTALVAKQAATLDVLSQGRLRLGVGLGWNAVEYTALNQDFHTRGRRIEEQAEVLRLLWTQPLVNYTGRWHTIPDAGLNPLPVQRPIPLWFGGYDDRVLRRIARIGDGWLPGFGLAGPARPALDKLAAYLEEAGRPPSAVGLEPRLKYGSGRPDEWAAAAEDWRQAGATHLSFNTLGHGFTSPAQHLGAAEQFAKIMGLSG